MKGGDPVQKKMEEVAVYIQQHIHDGLCLEDLARQFHYSPYHLSRTFKKEMGYSIKEYMEALKIKGSIDHLVLNPQKITDTALDHGYSSPTTFSATFKRHTGLAPKKFIRESTLSYRFLQTFLTQKEVLVHREKQVVTNNRLSVKLIYPDDYQPHISCVGLFKSRIPKENPIVGAAMSRVLTCVFDNVPNGSYYLLACELLENLSFKQTYVLDENFRQGPDQMLHFSGDTQLHFELNMRRPIASDPPTTMNVPRLVKQSLMDKINSPFGKTHEN